MVPSILCEKIVEFSHARKMKHFARNLEFTLNLCPSLLLEHSSVDVIMILKSPLFKFLLFSPPPLSAVVAADCRNISSFRQILHHHGCFPFNPFEASRYQWNSLSQSPEMESFNGFGGRNDAPWGNFVHKLNRVASGPVELSNFTSFK